MFSTELICQLAHDAMSVCILNLKGKAERERKKSVKNQNKLTLFTFSAHRMSHRLHICTSNGVGKRNENHSTHDERKSAQNGRMSQKERRQE